MRGIFRRGPGLVLAAILAGSGTLSAAFVAPADGPVPFRRDRLPLDVDTMTSLSRQLMVLGRTSADFPRSPRSIAQIAALALALDPSNREARELIAAMEAGTPPEADAREAVERALSRAWQTLSWLEMPEAGGDGNALAACLTDVLATADPEHPRAKVRPDGEAGAWAGWVAEPAAFAASSGEKVTVLDPATMTDEEKDDAGLPAKPEPADPLALREVEISMPGWQVKADTGDATMEMLRVRLRAEPREEKGIGFEIAGEGLTERFRQPMKRVQTALAARHGSLPAGLAVSLDFGPVPYNVAQNGDALTAAALLLADSAISGRKPLATCLATVGEGGKLELPPKFWHTLRGIAGMQGGGGRLILPASAAEFLPALLTLDHPDFFLKWEILLAADAAELCDLAGASAGAPGPSGDVAAKFAEIRTAGQGKPLAAFLGHSATQQRLREVLDLQPKHASARMLAMQGSGSRPRFLSRAILAREIRSALEPANVLLRVAPTETLQAELQAAHTASRARLDALTAYTEFRDRELHKQAVDAADVLRSLARLISKDDTYGTLYVKQQAAVREARASYVNALHSLTSAAGDEADYPLPKLPER